MEMRRFARNYCAILVQLFLADKTDNPRNSKQSGDDITDEDGTSNGVKAVTVLDTLIAYLPYAEQKVNVLS